MDLKKIADETKAELPKVLSTIPQFDATASSCHNLKDLDKLDPAKCPGFAKTRIQVVDMDSFDAALSLDPTYTVHEHLNPGARDRPPQDEDMDIDTYCDYKDPNARIIKPVAVLNLASERSPGGGWQNGALAQEECLCYRSSLYLSLHDSYYRLPSLSAIYTPNVVLIRNAMSAGHTLLTPTVLPKDLPVTSVISIAALRRPKLSDDKKSFCNEGTRAETKRKIRVVLRIAAVAGHTRLVLGALGCGVFANPPQDVARCFAEVLQEPEFKGGWWEAVTFAVLDNVVGGGKDGDGNFGVFYRMLDGEEV